MVRFGRYFSESADFRRRLFTLPALVALGLAAAFLVFLVTRFDIDLDAAWGQIRNSNPWYLALAVLAHYTTFIFRGARWRLLLQNSQGDGSPTPGILYCAQLVLLGWFANAVGWLRLGDAYRAYLYREEQDASFSRTVGTILAERVLDAILVALLLVVSVPFLVKGNGAAAWSLLVIAVALVVVLAILLAVMMWARERALRKLPAWLAERYRRFHEGTLGSFQRMLPVTLWGLMGWSAEVARFYLVVTALHLDFSLALVIFLTLANSLLTLVPTPGGFGAVESSLAGLLVRLTKLTSSTAAAVVLVDRSITYLSIIVVGALLFLGRQAFRRRNRVAIPTSFSGIEDR